MSSFALPELKSRIRLDNSEALTNVASVKEQVSGLGRATETSGEGGAFNHITTALRSVKEQTDQVIERVAVLGETTAKVGAGAAGLGAGGGGVFDRAGGMFSSLGPLAALAGITAVGAELEHLTTKTADYSSAVIRNSELLGLNTEQYQGLYRAAVNFGIEHEDLTRTLINFQRQITEGAPMLKRLGLDLGDVGITSTDTGTAINQLSTFLHNNTDEAQRNAVGMALLGRNGVSLIEILSKGPAAIVSWTQGLKENGLILDDNALKTGAAAKAIHDQMGLALQGIELQLGTRLEGAFSALWLTIARGASQSKDAFKGIGDAIAGVVGAIASFVQGLFGLDINFKDLNDALHNPLSTFSGLPQPVNDASAAFDGLSGSVDAAAKRLEALREATRHEVDAIDDQVKALRDQQSTLDASVQSEITAITRREQAVQDQIRDSQLLQQQEDEQHTSFLSHLQDQLDALTHTQDDRRHGGETLIDYERRLQINALRDQIKDEQERRATVKTTQEIALQHLKEQDQAERNSLEDQKARQKDATADQVAQLEARKTALTRHLQDEEAAAKNSQSKLSAGYAGLSSSITHSMGAAGASTKDVFTQMEIHASEKAKQIGQDIADIFRHPENFLNDALKLGALLGEAIGGAIVGGVARKAGDIIFPWVTDPQHVTPWNPLRTGGGDMDPYITDPKTGKPMQGTWQPNGDFIGNDGRTYKGGRVAGGSGIDNSGSGWGARASGGPVLSSLPAMQQAHTIGADLDVYMVGENGPEPAVFGRNGYVVSREDAMARLGSMPSQQGGDTFVANFFGPVADALVARRVTDEWESKQRRKALSVRPG